MIEFLRWAIVLEIVGIAFLPLTAWLLRWLPDRGYALSKVMGLVLVTYVTWIVGSFVPIAGSPLLPVLALLGAAALWLRWGRELRAQLRQVLGVVIVEEALFLAALVIWSLFRAYLFHPAIAHTEQFMDMSILGASLRSGSYPPYDPWMSGHTINYYYFGYLTWALVTRLSAVAPTVGYNLALSSLFALTVSGAYSVGYALTRKIAWAAVAPLFVALMGNWHAILFQVWQGQLPSGGGWWFWDSTRVVGGDATINEFPFFSFILGDLHPHVMALPVTILAVALGCSLLHSDAPFGVDLTLPSLGRLALVAAPIGSLFATNSWDFPTYLLVVSACIAAGAYLLDESTVWWRRPLVSVAALAVASVALFTPFYVHFRSLASGIGLVYTPSLPGQFLEVFGLYLLTAALLVGSLALLLQPVDEEALELEAPSASSAALGITAQVDSVSAVLIVACAAVIVLGLHFHLWTLLLILALLAGTLMVLGRVLNAENANRADAAALILVLVGCLVLAVTEVIYLRDSFDGSAQYRMNTVFKFYYQAWTLLGLAAAYGVWRSLGILRRYVAPALVVVIAALMTVGIAGGAVYTVLAPDTQIQDFGDRGLDGMAWLQYLPPDPGSADAAGPADYLGIRWLQSHAAGDPVVLEAAGGGYSHFARVSTFTALPTLMGWADHEGQWRGADPEIGTRQADVQTIYSTRDGALALRLLKKYRVQYVFVGHAERKAYGQPDRTLRTILRPVYRGAVNGDSVTIYATTAAQRGASPAA